MPMTNVRSAFDSNRYSEICAHYVVSESAFLTALVHNSMSVMAGIITVICESRERVQFTSVRLMMFFRL